ncbi:hypothetical protein ACFVMC_32975 [Nocardia sp. NPDC127579]|uniref:hypothetical protein n=1 Tax=Nocardia sp. NPDC127579 TaxID=3345402 RepID=UPI00363579DB
MSRDALDDMYTARYADKVADPEEARMRADYDRAADLWRSSLDAETEHDMDLLIEQADQVSGRWSQRDDEYGQAWRDLEEIHQDWKRAPDTMGRLHDQVIHDRAQGWDVMVPMTWRHMQQGRELTGHGSWTDSLATTSADSARYTPEFPPPVFGRTTDRTADSGQPVSALAGLGGNAFGAAAERDGAER